MCHIERGGVHFEDLSTMSGSKAVLKAINDAIRQQKFDDAISQAQEFLQKESKNYQAYVHLLRDLASA